MNSVLKYSIYGLVFLTAAFSFSSGWCYYVDRMNSIRYNHPLRDYIGFTASKNLEDGTKISYRISPQYTIIPFLGGSAKEIVEYRIGDSLYSLVDRNFDGQVDDTNIRWTDNKTRDAFLSVDADELFGEAKEELDVNSKLVLEE